MEKRITLNDQMSHDGGLPVKVIIDESAIMIKTPTIDTFSEAEGFGGPIIIEFYEGALRLLAFDNEHDEPVVDHRWTQDR